MSARAMLRQQCRDARAALGAQRRASASHAISLHLCRSALLRGAQRIAIYWPVGDEVDLRDVLACAGDAGKQCYLPRMLSDRRLQFLRHRPDAPLITNRYGIPEPPHVARDELAPGLLDLVCVPLLAFDRAGNRLGQGGGFYDRSFAFAREAGSVKPLLVGTGFACQELPAIAREEWDVPLAAVVTEDGLIDCRPH
jgi:5-formyltetrahydrofolate cyclo-ligase